MKLRTWATGAGALALLAMGIGTGVHSSWSDSATATETTSVGTLSCVLSSTDPNAMVTNGGHTLTATLPPILSSASGSRYLSDLTVKNSGSITDVVHWTSVTGGTLAANQWQPAGFMGYASGSQVDLMSTDLLLTGGQTHTYTADTGFQWAALDNSYEGKTASVSYTANCSEVPPPALSKISFVGAASMAIIAPATTTAAICPSGIYDWVSTNANQWCGNGTFPVASTTGLPSSGSFTVTASGGSATVAYTGTTSTSFTGVSNTSSATGYVTPGAVVTGPRATLSLPAGATAGDIAIVETQGLNSPAFPAGYTAFEGGYQVEFSYRVLVAGDTAVPAQTTAWATEEVAVYRGVSAIGAHTNYGGFRNDIGGASYPLPCLPLSLSKTDGSSWVACMGYDGYASTNANQMVFDSNTTNRSASLSDKHTGLADTNGGMAAWAKAGWPGDNFPLPGSHAVTVASIELLSK